MELVYDYRTLHLFRTAVLEQTDGTGRADVSGVYVRCWRGWVGANFMWIISD